MRISDWSSDVCSSDLRHSPSPPSAYACQIHAASSRPDGRRHSCGPVVPQSKAQAGRHAVPPTFRSEEHTSELQSLMRISYAVFCLKKKKLTPLYTKQLTPKHYRPHHVHSQKKRTTL